MYEFNEKIICPWDKTADAKRIKQYRSYYKVKHDIVAELQPKTIIEIGVRAGYSAYYFLQACPEAQYYGFDADNGKHGGAGPKPYIPWAEKILEEAGRSFKIYWPFDTQEAACLPHQGDFYHIDGDHTTEGVKHDLDICFAFAPPGAHILVDDYDYLKSVREGIDQWLERNVGKLTYEYRQSLRGEILIRKDTAV
jgi:cephalosporin hydroxylase